MSSLQPMAIASCLLFSFWWMMGRYLAQPAAEAANLPEVRLDIRDGIDRSYTGDFSSDSRFADLVERLAGLREAALREAHDRLGLPIEQTRRIVLAFRDAPAAVGGSCRAVRSDGREVILVSLSVRPLLFGIIDLKEAVEHELIHGILREQMGPRRYFDLPRWVREGVAIWGARQLRERIDALVAEAMARAADLAGVLSEVRNPCHADEYLMDAMMFEYVDQNHGLGKVQSVIADIVAGQDYRLAFEQNTGFPWDLLEARRDLFADMVIQGAVIERVLGDFANAGGLVGEGDPRSWLLVSRWCQERLRNSISVQPPPAEVNPAAPWDPRFGQASFLASACFSLEAGR